MLSVPTGTTKVSSTSTTSRSDAASHGLENEDGYRVLHIVDESLPLVSGYAVRTKGITDAQIALGNTPVVLTGPTHQLRDTAAKDIALDGVSYIRTPTPTGIRRRAIQQRWPVARELSIISA